MPVIPDTIGPSQEAVNLLTWGGYQFAVWYTLAGELRIGRITRGTHQWGVNHLEYEFAGTPRTALALPVTNDGHNIAAIAVDGLGKLHVWANMHVNSMRAVVTTASHETDGWLTTAGWASAAADFPSVDTRVTYPFPCTLPDGSLIFYARTGGTGSGSGRSDSQIWRRAAGGTTWTGPTTLFQGLSVPDAKGPGVPGDDATNDTEFNWNAYPSGPLVVESPRHPHPGRIHMCWGWRIDANVENLNPLLSYAYSDDNAVSWKAVDGTALTVPMTPLNNVAARIPGHARILTMTRASNVVTATLDTANHGVLAGGTYTVQCPSDPTFDGAFGIFVVNGATVIWTQGGSNATATFGYIGRDDYQNGQGLTIDDGGHPHVVLSQLDTWWLRHDGTTWTQTVIANPLHGVTHTNIGTCVWNRGRLLLLKGGTASSGFRYPTAWSLTGDAVTIRMGGPVSPFGGHEPGFDPEALRRFGTVEVLTCDGDRPRVYTFGRGSRAVAHVA